MLERAMYYLLSIFIWLSLLAFYQCYKHAKERKLRELVAWSAVGDYCPAVGAYSYSDALIRKALNAQHSDAIDIKYRISGEQEQQYLMQIIDAYQLEIMRSYFLGRLSTIKSKYAVNGDVYFLIKLHDFLSAHCDDYEFLGHDMRNSSNPPSEFKIVYNKLFYITHMFCKGCPITNPQKSQYWMDWEEKCTREFLDSHQIQQP